MNKIRDLSRVLKYIFYGLLIVYPLFAILSWVLVDPSVGGKMIDGFEISIGALTDIKILHKLTALERFLGFLVDLVPDLLTITVIYCLARLFTLYEHGKIFVIDSSRYLRRIGFLMLTGNIVSPLIFNPLLHFVLTRGNPEGERFVSVAFRSDDLSKIVLSLMVILVSWIMTEACKLQEEQKLIV